MHTLKFFFSGRISLFTFAALLLLCSLARVEAQNVRYSAPFPSVSSTTATPFLVANVPPNSPVIAVCNSPANQVPCTNYATTYTSLGVACLNGAQDTPDPQPSNCQATGDAQGNIGFWAPAGTYDYTICIQNSTSCLGPYTVTLGGIGVGGPQGTASPAWIGDWEGTLFNFQKTLLGQFNAASINTVNVFMFRLTSPFSFNKLSFTPSTVSGSPLLGIAIYSASGTRLVHWEVASVSTQTSVSATGGAVLLQPGYYYWAYASSLTSSALTQGGLLDSDQTAPWNLSGGLVRTGTAANLMSAGVLPATLGVLTAGTNNGSSVTSPMWIVEP